MGIIYEEENSKWFIEARTKSIVISDGDRTIELDNEEMSNFVKLVKKAKTLVRSE
jgi:hypothetical protein